MGTLELSGLLLSALYCRIIPVPNSTRSYSKNRHVVLSMYTF